MTYYGMAITERRPNGRPKSYGILEVTKNPGEHSRQTWTGDFYKTEEVCFAAMNAKNAARWAEQANH